MFDQLSSETASHIEAGNKAASRAQFAQAVEEFTRAIDSDPRCYQAYMMRSYANAAIGDYEAAIRDLDVALESDPASAELYQLRAGYHLRLLHFPEVIMDTTMAIQLGGDVADGCFRRGSAYLSAGDVERALTDLRVYVDMMGEASTPWAVETIEEMEAGGDLFQLTDPSFYQALGQGYLDRLNVEQAIIEFTSWIDLQPTAEAFAARGGAYALLGRNEEALADLMKAVEMDEDQPEAYRHIAHISLALDQQDIAIESFDYAIMLKPDDPMLYFSRGEVLREMGEVANAISDLSRAIELGLEQPKVFYERGMAQMSNGNVERAMMDFNYALTLQPDYADAYVARGQASTLMGYISHALIDLKRAVEIAPYVADAHYHLGNAYEKSNDEDRALQHYREYMKLAGAMADQRVVALLRKVDPPEPELPKLAGPPPRRKKEED